MVGPIAALEHTLNLSESTIWKFKINNLSVDTLCCATQMFSLSQYGINLDDVYSNSVSAINISPNTLLVFTNNILCNNTPESWLLRVRWIHSDENSNQPFSVIITLSLRFLSRNQNINYSFHKLLRKMWFILDTW